MTPAQRCDEIIRLIDEALDATAHPAPSWGSPLSPRAALDPSSASSKPEGRSWPLFASTTAATPSSGTSSTCGGRPTSTPLPSRSRCRLVA